MSVFGSLFTAVSGLSAQSQSIGMISNNIANVSTVGYKRTDAAFSSLVTSESRSTLYSPGSVRASQNARIDLQGILQQSNSSTDVALSGNGFFVVKRSSTDTSAEPLYTRAGSFSEDSSGTLRNTSGFYLMGWPLDQDGGIIGSQTDINSLVPVDVAFLGGLTQPTTTAGLAVNLDNSETQTVYPVAPGSTPNFTRDLRVYDSFGGAQDVTINFTKHASPTASVTGVGSVDLGAFAGPIVGNVPGVTAGDQFTINSTSAAVNPTTITIGATTTVSEMLASINSIVDAQNRPVVYASVDGNGHLSIKNRNYSTTVPAVTNSLTVTSTTGTPLADFDLGVVDGVTQNGVALTPDDLLSVPADTPNTEGWWQMEFRSGSAPFGVIKTGSINFNGAGQLNATADINGDFQVALDDIDWGNASALQDISFDIGSFTQFSGEYNVISSDQNGAELGLRTGVSIDREGFVTAQFSNGQSARIYKLAVATFSNSNGLDQLTGNVFRQSDSSGEYNLREAGSGSAGQIESGALEASNVDLADEFAKMIVTQRAYSANTKVISTADTMTEELLRLR